MSILPTFSGALHMQTYADHIDQTFPFPTEEFRVENNQLFFNEIDLNELIKKHGTPLKITYLPKIEHQISKAKKLFENAMSEQGYKGRYLYSYCTKASHFKFVLEEVLKNSSHLETSAAYDLEMIRQLNKEGTFPKEKYILCNGYKRPAYRELILQMLKEGYSNCIPIIDSISEGEFYQNQLKQDCQVGIRVASDEEPTFEFYTSRLGVGYKKVKSLYSDVIRTNPHMKLKLLHFFINTGIRDSAYYWKELNKFVTLYCELKKECPDLDTIDIGGGLPIKTSLMFEFDFQGVINQVIETIRSICLSYNVKEPDIFTEFGSFTVGETGAMIYSVLDQKKQNDVESWYMIDGSFITHLPDTWAINQRFLLLAVNNWNKPYKRVNLGGLTCDSMDYYNSEAHTSEVLMPVIEGDEQQYIGLFHTGAYQESIGGYGGLQHCLIPAPKHIILKTGDDGRVFDEVFNEEQGKDGMLEILGF